MEISELKTAIRKERGKGPSGRLRKRGYLPAVFYGPQAETILLGNIALLTRKKLEWDAENLRITNVPEANDYLRPKYREGWGV